MSDPRGPAELPATRRAALARLVATRGFLRVTDAAEWFAVSDVTIRTDLDVLEAEGALVRVHGGAMPTSALVPQESSIESTRDRDAAAKRAIGRAAAQLVASGESVYLDAGSTALAVAEALADRQELEHLVVVTSGLATALALERAIPRFSVVVTGGTLRPLQHSLVSPFAAPMLDALHLDWAFIGCNGVDSDAGVTNVNLPEAEIKSRVMRIARRAVAIADSSKLGKVELARIGAVDDFFALVTNGEFEAEGLQVVSATR
jgi:DeoR family transcriptional regulator, aga operon transcriptional repressor